MNPVSRFIAWLFPTSDRRVSVEMTPQRAAARRTGVVLDNLILPRSIPWRDRRRLRAGLKEYTETATFLPEDEATARLLEKTRRLYADPGLTAYQRGRAWHVRLSDGTVLDVAALTEDEVLLEACAEAP